MNLAIASQPIHESRVVVHVAGEIDIYSAPQLKSELQTLTESGYSDVVINMNDVPFIDSSGLGVLVVALKRAAEGQGTLRIVCTSEPVLKVLRITGLDKAFDVFQDIESATA